MYSDKDMYIYFVQIVHLFFFWNLEYYELYYLFMLCIIVSYQKNINIGLFNIESLLKSTTLCNVCIEIIHWFYCRIKYKGYVVSILVIVKGVFYFI